MVNRTFLLLFYLVFSLFVQSAFTARFDESMNEFKQSVYNGAKTVKDSATSAGAYIKNKANHFMHAPAQAPQKAKHHKFHAYSPDASAPANRRRLLQVGIDDVYKSRSRQNHASTDAHKIVLHTSKIPTYNDVTGDPKTTFQNWAYAPNPAAAPMKHKASQMYHSATGAVKDTRKKIHNTIHSEMSDMMPKPSKYYAKKTFNNRANAPTPATGAVKDTRKEIHNTIHSEMSDMMPKPSKHHAKKTFNNRANAPTPATGAVKDTRKEIHNTIHSEMSDMMPKPSKHHAKKTFNNRANAPTPAAAPTVQVVSEAAKKKIHSTIHMATKGMNEFLPMTAKHHFSDVTGRSAYAPSHAPTPSAVNAASKRIHKTIHTAMNSNSHTAKPTAFSDATGKTAASFHDWANSPSPLSGHAPRNSVSNAAAHKIHKTIHAAKKEKHHFDDVTGRDAALINNFAHSPAPASYAAAPANKAGKKLHHTIHAAMNEKARQILPNKGKHYYNDMTGVINDFAHAPAPSPARHAVGSAKTFEKRIHDTIHVALDKASKTTKHQYSDKTGPGSVVAGGFTHSPAPSPTSQAVGSAKTFGKRIHNTIHVALYKASKTDKHQFSDKTGPGSVAAGGFTHSPAPAPSRQAVGSAKTFGKRIHNTIHAALDAASKTTKRQFSDKTGPGSVVAGGFTHAPAPAPYAAVPTKNVGKKIHNTIHTAKNDKTKEATKHQYSDSTGVDPAGINGFTHAPAPSVHGAEKHSKKHLHKTVHLAGNSPNPETTDPRTHFLESARQGDEHFQSHFPHLSTNPWTFSRP